MAKNVIKLTKNLKVLVASNIFPEKALNILEENFTVLMTNFSSYNEQGKKENRDEIIKLIPGCSALILMWNYKITTEFIDKAGPQLKIVAAGTAGYDHCNLPELTARGIHLSNTPKITGPAVAEVAVGLVLATARRFTENLERVRKGRCYNGQLLGQDVRGSTVGIVGFGDIGQAVVKRLVGFEVGRFLYTSHRKKPEAEQMNAKFVPLNELLLQSDIVILAAPLTDKTRHMINETTLAKMKKNAILVNVGRGDLVDQDALYDALKKGAIYGAGLDVTTPEPLPKDHKLLTLPKLFVLPHIGVATVRTRSDMAVLAANNVVNALNGKPLITPVLP